MFVTKKKYKELKAKYIDCFNEYSKEKQKNFDLRNKLEDQADVIVKGIKEQLLNNKKLSKTSKKEIERCL